MQKVNADDLAATLIAEIETQSGLSQAELARRAGLDRSVLNAYGRGRRQPSVAALGRIARAASLELAEREGQVRLRWGITPVDLFLSVLPFHDHVQQHARLVPFEGRTIPVLSCTALAVFKALFDRPRDWVDIEAMVEARSLDVDEAMRWVREMVGDDPRVERLAELRALRRSQAEPPPLRPKPNDAADAGV